MIPYVAQNTTTIRVGSGGVMMPHYSAFKVAETFNTLASMHPGRIDLGIGRAEGLAGAQRALAHPGSPVPTDAYGAMVTDLAGHLHDGAGQ